LTLAPQEPSVVLYDGVCYVCNGSVGFILRHDPAARFRFAPLQSEAAARLLAPCRRDPAPLSTIVLIEDGRCYDRSDAILRIAARLGFPWSLAQVGRLVPRAWRDALYDAFAARRYGWFGRRETCAVPPEQWRDRFLG
jgi:predicted DCC family thiol-disulfide oxidoreductase YuxK